MKVILLAGGFGSRLSEYTESIPKPMVPIGNRPIMWHIMRSFAHYEHKDFYVALGYKSEVVKEFFLHYRTLNADFTVDLLSGDITPHQLDPVDWRITLVDTGEGTMTGGRAKRMASYIGHETCILTYGDGLADIDIDALIAFHKGHGKLVTVTAVHPVARFGEIEISGDVVTSFREKPQVAQGWVNGGFFVIEPGFFEFIEGDSTVMEKEPLETVAQMGELRAFRHEGFWQCMDTKRDLDLLQKLWSGGEAPWVR